MNISRTLRPLFRGVCDLRVRTLRTVGRPEPTLESSQNSSRNDTKNKLPLPKLQPLSTINTHNREAPTIGDDIDWPREMQRIRHDEQSRSVLDPVADNEAADFTVAAPPQQPAHNLAAYVRKSATLQQFIHLGVDLHRIERRAGLGEFLLRLDFERDVQPHLRFLSDAGVPAEGLGAFLTRNPLIFKEDLDTLHTRINYLQSKSFAAADIGRIVSADPYWLMFSTQRIDGRLGFFQKHFELSGAQLRQLAVRLPRLITYGLDAVRRSSFVVQEELGFSREETQQLVLAAPKLWMMSELQI